MARLHKACTLPAVLLLAPILVASCGHGSRSGIAGSIRAPGLFGGTDPLRGQVVVVYAADARQPIAKATTGPDGLFFISLGPGAYRYEILAGGHSGGGHVDVPAGQVADVSEVGGIVAPDAQTERRLRRFGRQTAQRLSLTRGSAQVSFWGSSANGAQRLFGDNAPSGAQHVWIYMLTGHPGGSSPRSPSTRALHQGGYVAYELDAATFRVLASLISSSRWHPPKWVRNTRLWGPEFGTVVW
jgi:hypothetical protein